MDGYTLTQSWFSFMAKNADKIDCKHTALYLYIVEQFNKRHWVNSIGLPTDFTMGVLNIKSYKTYKKILEDLIDFGFIKFVEKSTNQYTANVIALVKKTNSSTTHVPSQDQLNASINKTYKHINNKHIYTVLSFIDSLEDSKKINDCIAYLKKYEHEDSDLDIKFSDVNNISDFDYEIYQHLNKGYLVLAYRYWQLWKKQFPKHLHLEKTKVINWYDTIRLMIERDKQTIERIIGVYVYFAKCVDNTAGYKSFLFDKVKSLPALRESTRSGEYRMDFLATEANNKLEQDSKFSIEVQNTIKAYKEKYS